MRVAHMSGFVLWFTGLSGAGKTTIANIVEPELERRGFVVDHLDGDIVRTHLSKGLGYSKEDRDINIARIAWVASRVARAGAAVIVSAISPYEEARRHARSLVDPPSPFVEVRVAPPIAQCARRAPKAFRPAKFPFPVMHVDTGHNFREVVEYRDRRVAELGERLVIASVQQSIDRGRVQEQTGPRASRNQLQTTTLLDAIEEHQFDAAMGGARRDEEPARAKERIFSFRDDFGQWNPRAQRAELSNLYNARIRN